ncbi:uncharacterized protein METZ01_LOCUS478975, partial [marine metagenome]
VKLIAFSLCVCAQVVCLEYTTLKIANQFAAKLIDNGISQSLVTENQEQRVNRNAQLQRATGSWLCSITGVTRR